MLLIISEFLFLLISQAISFNNLNTDNLDYVQLIIDVCLLAWFCVKAHQQYYPEYIYEQQNLDEVISSKNTNIKNLIYALEVDELYQNQDLNLKLLSEQINISKKNLSLLIKENYEKSFTTFINDYRLKEVIDRLKNGEDKTFTILAIAFDSGFSSRTSFYRYFNDNVGVSPKVYIENLKSITGH